MTAFAVTLGFYIARTCHPHFQNNVLISRPRITTNQEFLHRYRARVKSGVKILDAAPSNPDWIVESEIKAKNTVATFTVRRKENASRVPSG